MIMKGLFAMPLLGASLACAAGPAYARDGWNAAAAILGAAGGFAFGSALAHPYPGSSPAYSQPHVYAETIEETPACDARTRDDADDSDDLGRCK